MLPEILSPFTLPPLDQVPDDEQDKPRFEGHLQDETRPLGLPRIIFGAGAFSNQYNKDTHLASAAPLRTVRLALRYGVRAFDTSPYYGPSEIILGDCLKALSGEFPRSSYQLMTKCGRYGPSTFDYKPATIRESVERSLKRLHTVYLDTVFLHDVEFVCTQVAPRVMGDNSTALDTEAPEFGLADGQEAKIHGDGDQKILDAFAELRKMKEEGLIKNVGITGLSLDACNIYFAECFLGYPLPTLLRLALCILHNPPYEPVDVILSYSHLNLQNSTFLAFAPHLTTRAKVKQLLAASPLSMGLLAPSPPQWHPAPPPLKASTAAAGKLWDKGLPDLALGYAIRFAEGVPLVAGFSNPEEVHHCLRISKEVSEGDNKEKRVEAEQLALATFRDAGYLGWSWSSP